LESEKCPRAMALACVANPTIPGVGSAGLLAGWY
jgi:hypothetical protein